MPLYRYSALSEGAKKLEGLLEADSLDAAKEQLRRRQILVTKLTKEKPEQTSLKLSSTQLLSFTRDLSSLLKAGLPLYESLLAIEEKHQGAKSHTLFLRLCEGVKQGKALSYCFAEFPKAFDRVYIAMVSAGEETGNLLLVFSQLTKLISRSQKIKKQTTTALIYPGFLISFCMIVIFALFFFLIPSMEDLFEGRKLHPMTETVLSVSHFFKENQLSVLLSLCSFIFSMVVFIKSAKGKETLKRFGLRLPILATLMTQAVLSRFCRVLSVLLRSSVPLVAALPLARKVMFHPSFEQVIEKAEEKLIEGKPLSGELKSSKFIPKLMIRMLSIAEETGDVSGMLESLAEIYEEDLEKSLTRMTNMLQPVILLILGLIVGVVLLSVMLPLTDVSSFLE